MILSVTQNNFASLVSRSADEQGNMIEDVLFCAGTFPKRKTLRRWAKREIPGVSIEFAEIQEERKSSWKDRQSQQQPQGQDLL